VEQNVAFGLQLVDHVNVLQVGRVVHRGPVHGLDQEALAGYLGIGRLLGAGISQSIAGRATTPTTRRRTRRRREGLTAPSLVQGGS
jgi:hypothetical protein